MEGTKNKNVLLITGMEDQLEQSICHAASIQPENTVILKSVFPHISQPYSDLMRDIITLVIQNKTEEILIVRSKNEDPADIDLDNYMLNNPHVSDRLKTIDYLFQHGNPEFPFSNLNEWLNGGKPVDLGIKQSVDMIRQHPFIPSHVKVRGFLIDTEHEVLTEINAE
ncbi:MULTISPECIES: carbonic anhydrase [Bacillus]|uniref:carbonic anhydrase n=1 Tax=Bacillus TaxID=1386 RepID=UPI0004138A4D|nr:MULTISPECIES: carbonic anhydrase [Bacillus]QHZ48246.1 carbonic anhydrase [Bacillus sp. NSP9.1]WFA06089.1 carbonic anhydrase [Bacillus sp. HSf4]